MENAKVVLTQNGQPKIQADNVNELVKVKTFFILPNYFKLFFLFFWWAFLFPFQHFKDAKHF